MGGNLLCQENSQFRSNLVTELRTIKRFLWREMNAVSEVMGRKAACELGISRLFFFPLVGLSRAYTQSQLPGHPVILSNTLADPCKSDILVLI